MSIGKNIKKFRLECNLTQEELAKKLNTSRSNIANYENGNNLPSVDMLVNIAIALDCSVDDLVELTSKKEKYSNLIGEKLDIKDLTEDDIKKLQEEIEYMKWKKRSKQDKGDK